MHKTSYHVLFKGESTSHPNPLNYLQIKNQRPVLPVYIQASRALILFHIIYRTSSLYLPRLT